MPDNVIPPDANNPEDIKKPDDPNAWTANPERKIKNKPVDPNALYLHWKQTPLPRAWYLPDDPQLMPPQKSDVDPMQQKIRDFTRNRNRKSLTKVEVASILEGVVEEAKKTIAGNPGVDIDAALILAAQSRGYDVSDAKRIKNIIRANDMVFNLDEIAKPEGERPGLLRSLAEWVRSELIAGKDLKAIKFRVYQQLGSLHMANPQKKLFLMTSLFKETDPRIFLEKLNQAVIEEESNQKPRFSERRDAADWSFLDSANPEEFDMMPYVRFQEVCKQLNSELAAGEPLPNIKVKMLHVFGMYKPKNFMLKQHIGTQLETEQDPAKFYHLVNEFLDREYHYVEPGQFDYYNAPPVQRPKVPTGGEEIMAQRAPQPTPGYNRETMTRRDINQLRAILSKLGFDIYKVVLSDKQLDNAIPYVIRIVSRAVGETTTERVETLYNA